MVPAAEARYGHSHNETFGMSDSSLSQTRFGKMTDKRGQINGPGYEATCAANERQSVVR